MIPKPVESVFLFSTIFALSQAATLADETLAKGWRIHFATVEEAKACLAERDVYIEGLETLASASIRYLREIESQLV